MPKWYVTAFAAPQVSLGGKNAKVKTRARRTAMDSSQPSVKRKNSQQPFVRGSEFSKLNCRISSRQSTHK